MRWIISLLPLLVAIWPASNIITEDSPNDLENINHYKGLISSVSCEYFETKHKSYYLFTLLDQNDIKVRVSKHKCYNNLENMFSGKLFEGYFLGGLPLQVYGCRVVLFDYLFVVYDNNTVFISIIFLLLLSFFYIQYLYTKKNRNINKER